MSGNEDQIPADIHHRPQRSWMRHNKGACLDPRKEEWDLKHIWVLYCRFLAEDAKQWRCWTKYTVTTSILPSSTHLGKGLLRVGCETQKTGGLGFYQDITCDFRFVWIDHLGMERDRLREYYRCRVPVFPDRPMSSDYETLALYYDRLYQTVK